MPKVCAMLAWWDEPAPMLERCVLSLSGFCTDLVAVDGGYQMVEGATPTSKVEQRDIILHAAHKAGVRVRVYEPDDLWAGQVAKRDFMIKRAEETGADWLYAIDADHVLECDAGAVHAELEQYDPDIVTVAHDFYTPPPEQMSDIGRISPHEWHTKLAGKHIDHSLVIRCLDEMMVSVVHWGYSGIPAGGNRIALGGWRNGPYREGRKARLQSHFCVVHECFLRDQMRLDRNRDYCRVRDKFRRGQGFEP